MGHPLEMDLEAMRRAGYATVDALVARLADPSADPVLRRADPAAMQQRLGGPAPEAGRPYEEVLARVVDDVLPFASRTDHPGYFAFVPSFTTWPAALAELTAAAANPYCGAWMESAGPTQVELEVLGWFGDWLGLPETTAGLLVSGGSQANLTALLVARSEAGGPSPDSVLYVSDQAHSSLARTARAMGLTPDQVRVLPTDQGWRLRGPTVAAAVAADRAAGRVPFALCASAGSTNTGTVDPLDELADVAAAEQLWLHVDAAYGGFAALSERGRSRLAGIERADSVTLDPHKWLFQPMPCASVLVRDGAALERTFAIHPDYLDDNQGQGTGEVDFADRGLALSRGFGALKVWMSVQTFGLSAFRQAVDTNLDLAERAQALVAERPTLRLMAPAVLGIVCFRREWPGHDEAEIEQLGLGLVEALEQGGRALVSSTRLAGRHAVRLCVLNPTSTEDDVAAVIEHFATAPVPAAVRRTFGASELRASVVGAPAPGRWAAFTCLVGASPETLAELERRAVEVEVGAGTEVVRRFDAGRSFYLVASGRFEAVLDDEVVRVLGPGDHFGELAARDWGGGYGYARLAGVRCAEAGRLLVLEPEDFAWLFEAEPGFRAVMAAAVAERLERR